MLWGSSIGSWAARCGALAGLLWVLSTPAYAAAVTIPPGVAAGQPYHLVFVTDETYGIIAGPDFPPPFGSINGLAGADWYVTFQAWLADLPVAGGESFQSAGWDGLELVYTAILSDSSTDANTRFAIDGPVFNTQGEKVADDYADFWDGSLDAAIRYDANGLAVATNRVWSGSTGAGNFSGRGAGDWMDSSTVAEYGLADRANVTWLDESFQSGSSSARLYGISPALVWYDPADTDTDGDVDTADLTVMFQNFTGDVGAAGMKDMMTGDTDADGDVDTADITTGLQNFTGSSAVSVPEPSTWVLLVLGGLGLVALRTRRAGR